MQAFIGKITYSRKYTYLRKNMYIFVQLKNISIRAAYH